MVTPRREAPRVSRGAAYTSGPADDDPPEGSTHGMRILIVEDETLVSLMLEEALHDYGCAVIGPAMRVAQALPLAESETLDCAILDINVHGERIYPVAAVLSRRDIPFVFVTGYGREDIKEPFRDRPVLRKPFDRRAIGKALARILGAKWDKQVMTAH